MSFYNNLVYDNEIPRRLDPELHSLPEIKKFTKNSQDEYFTRTMNLRLGNNFISRVCDINYHSSIFNFLR